MDVMIAFQDDYSAILVSGNEIPVSFFPVKTRHEAR